MPGAPGPRIDGPPGPRIDGGAPAEAAGKPGRGSGTPPCEQGKEGAITAGEVAEAAVSGLRAGQFLITTHPHTVKAFQIRAHKHERWLGNVRTLSAQTHEGLGGREAFPDKHGQGS